MPSPASKLVVIGIDAASPPLVRRWAAEGALPNVRALLERGLVGRTMSVEGFHVGATWPSFYTGVTPARHGCHYLLQLRPGTYDLYPVAEQGVARCEPFWRGLSRAGRRVAVLDVPLSALDTSVNGLQVVEWGSHDAVYGFRAWPPDVGHAIRARHGEHPVGSSCDGERVSARDYERFVRGLAEGARLKGELTRQLLGQGGWDFFMQVFSEAHCAGHQCWHLHDPAHPRHDRALAARVGDPLRRVYETIDRAIGGIVRDAGEAQVALVIAHGMGPSYGANFLLEDLLCALGVMRRAVPQPPADSPARHLARRAWRRLPAGVRRVAARFRAAPSADPPTLGIDPEGTLCFPHRNGQPVSGIRLNLGGREPRGRLAPGEADAFSARLARDLLDVVDEATGRPLVRRVVRTRDLYAGRFVEDLPDLLVEWSEDVGVGWPIHVRAASPRVGVIDGRSEWNRTGEHRPEGLFVAAGPGIARGELPRAVSVLDFAPTFTALLGVEWSGGDGRPIPGWNPPG